MVIKLKSGVCGFPGGSVVKSLPANAGDEGLIPGSDQKMHACMLDFIYVSLYIYEVG